MVPSIKTLQTRLSLPRERAIQLRKLLDGRLDPETFESVKKWVGQCYHKPRKSELVMCAANELLETHGVEAIEGSEYTDSYHGHIRYTYCNTGDAYAATLIRDCVKGRYLVSDWGTLVERDGL